MSARELFDERAFKDRDGAFRWLVTHTPYIDIRNSPRTALPPRLPRCRGDAGVPGGRAKTRFEPPLPNFRPGEQRHLSSGHRSSSAFFKLVFHVYILP